MFTVPSLRARECTDREKDALNLLFLAIPLLNVTLPFVWKSFPFIFTADCVLMAVCAGNGCGVRRVLGRAVDWAAPSVWGCGVGMLAQRQLAASMDFDNGVRL